jgi:site-specific DNA-cytosine methylase
MDDNIKKLHQALIDDGYDDVGTEQEFRDYVSDSKNVATLYNALSEAGYDNFKDQKSLETYLSAKAPVAQKPSTPQSSGQSVYSKGKKQTQYPQEVIDAFNSPDNKPGNFKDLAQLNDEYQRGELKKPGIISQALGMFSNVDAGNVGKEQKVGGMIANMLLGDNMQQPHDNNQQVQHLNQDNVPTTEQTKPTAKDADAITSAAPVQQVDAIYNKYVGKGDALSETMYDLMASGQAQNQEEAQNMAMGAMIRAASRLAQRTTDEFVSKLGDTVEGVDEAVMNGWHSHAVQDNLKKLASQYGIMNNIAVDENGQYITQTNGYDQFINGMVKPAMVESLVKKYGENYRKTAEDLATRLYSNDEVIQNQLMNQDIDEAFSSVISKYVNPSVVEEYNKAQEEGSKAFNEGMEGSQYIPANLRLGTVLGAQYEANEAKDPAKVLSSLQKKFGNLYRNPKFLNDMSNAAFKVMQRYGLNGTQSSDPKQFKPMINSVLKNELDKLEIKGMMPKGSAEYIMKTGLGNTIVGKITRKVVQTDYQNWLEDIANQQYQPGFWENVASGALTFAVDAWSYWLPGAAGGKLTKSMVAKAEGKLAGDLMAKGMERKMAERAAKVLIGKSKAAALKSGAAHGAVTFGGQSAISKPIDEIYRTGQFDENGKIYNPSVGKVIANTLGEVAKQSAVGAIMQGGTIANMVGKGRGLATNILADVGGKVADSGIMTGQQILERMAHDPNFKPTGKDAAESFLESMANLTAIGLPGMVGKYARFKDAREFNKKFDFTDQDIAELKRFGYDGLRDAFEKMGIGEYAVVGENAQRLDGQLTQKYMDLMNDKSVPEVLKAKMMAVVEGKRPSSFSPVIDSEVYRGDDGKYYLETYNKDGGVIDRKEYSSHDAARNDEKKLEYEKTLGLASVLEGEFHNEFTQEHLEGLYNKAAQKYNMGEKLTDEDKAAVYLYQNAGAIKEIMDKQQKGIILTDEEQKQVNAYRHYYDSALENSSVMREFVNTFEDSHDVAHGTLRKALESKDKKYAPLVESYLKELYNSIELKREMKQTMDDLYNTSHGNEQKRIEGKSPVSPVEGSSESSAGGQESPVSEEPAPYQDRTNSVSTPSDAEFAANPANLANENQSESKASDAFVMGQNAYKNGDKEGLKSIKYNAETAELRLKRAFANDTDRIQGVYNAVNKGTDIETYIEQRTNYLTPFQQEAIRKYAEAMDANKGAMDALEHADDGYADKLKQQLSQYTMENGNISSLTLTDGQRGYWKSKNEYGAGFGVFPDANGQPVVKQVPSSQVKENGKEIPLQEYVNQLATQKHEATKKDFNAIFDATSLKPNDTVSLSINDKDQPTEAKIVSVNPDGTISFNIAGSKNVTTVPVDTFTKFQKYALRNSINAELDAEDAERAEKEAIKVEAEKKQRFANGIVGLSEQKPDYSSKETDPKVAAEYLQEQYADNHDQLIKLVNGSRSDIKEQIGNIRKRIVEAEDWLDTNADLEPEQAQSREDKLKLAKEQLEDLTTRYDNWNKIRSLIMTVEEKRELKDERTANIKKVGIDKEALTVTDEREVPVLTDEELKKQYPTMDEASDYILSQRKEISKTQEELHRQLEDIDDRLNQYLLGESDLTDEEIRDFNTTKSDLEARMANLSASAKDLIAQNDSLKKLYKLENQKAREEALNDMSPAEQRRVKAEQYLNDRNISGLAKLYSDTSVDFMDDHPYTVDEYVASSIGRHALNYEGREVNGTFLNGLQQEFGGTRKDLEKIQVLAAEGKGQTFDKYVNGLYDNLPDNLRNQGVNTQEIRNSLLALLRGAEKYSDLKNYILKEKIAHAEEEMRSMDLAEEEQRAAYEEEKEQQIQEQVGDVSAKYSLSSETAGNGEQFYQDSEGNIDLANVPQEVFEQIGYTAAPFRLTPKMIKHMMDRHNTELKFSSPDEAIDFVRDVMNNFDHVRLGYDGALVFSIEDGRRRTGKRAVTILINNDNGKFYGLKTSGYESVKGLEKRPLLWERGANEKTSSTDAATASVTTSKSSLSSEQSGSASHQGNDLNSSGGKDTNNSDNLQEKGTKFSEKLQNAIAETETEPTEAQKKAGNYKKGHLSFGGYDYTVETPKGVTRSGKDEQGKPWSVTMHDTYGYILGKIGVDGDHIDMFINDAADLDTFDGNVYVVDQVNPETGEFDEHKVMYGYPDEAAATKAYLSNYSKGWKGLGKVTSVPKVTFDKWLESSDRKTKPFRDYAMIQHEQAKKANETLPFDAPMSMDDLPFHRDVKEVKPENLTEAQKVAYDAVSTMLKKAGIPVKVVSNEDMEKVAEAQDNLAVEMLLNDPRLRFYIKTPEQKEAAKAAYDWAAKNRPDKFKQYAIVNMDNPNQPPQYFEKKDLAEKWRKYYTNAWKIGNYKAFNLNKPFEEQIKDVKGDVPSEFDPYKAESLLNKRIELEKQIKETEDSYNAKKKERAEYQNQLMQDYMDQHGLSSENDIPDDVWTDYRDKSFEKYQDTLDDLFHKYVELDNQLKAVAEPGVQYLKGKGVVYGYTDGKEIVLNQEHLNPNTPIHEYQHLWRTAAKNMNPELIEHGDKLIMQTQLFADLKQDPNYNHLTDEQICDEAFARLTGEDGAAILEQMAKDAIKENPLDTAKELSVINKLKEWLKKFWYWTLDTFTKWKPEDIKKMTLEDIRNLVLRDLANGVDPRTKLHEAENADDIKFMGSTTKKRMKDISTQLEGRELDEAQQAVADVYSGKKDNVSLTVEREDGSNKIIMRQGNDNHAGTKHSVFRHYGVKANSLNVDDLLLIPTVLKEGERKVSDNGRVAYVYVDPTSQVKYTVVTEPKNNKEYFNDFYSNKKANPSETSRVVENSTNTPEGAHNNDGNAFMRAKVDNNSETAKENGENLSVEDKIKAVSQQFGVDEADVAMYANGVKKGSTAEAARARANIKRHLLQANEDKISSFKELLKYTVPVNNALKENFGDLDAMIEERVKQVEAQRNAMEAARKRAEEEEAKRQKHLEELSLIPDDQLDKQYMDALAKGDDATAREMLDEAARRKGYDDTESAYQGVGAWAAPGNPGYESDKARREDWESSGSDVNLEDMAMGYTPQPDDYFSHPERYSQNTPHGLESVKAISAAIDAIKNGEKDVKVKVYRAVPTSVKEGKLRNGDWVTPSKKYADIHGNNRLEGKYRIIEDEVPATQLWWDGNDANEFGFDDGKEYKYKNAKNNRKLNDLVTYDDEGDVIPPSKRFNSRKQDVRFMFGGEKGAAEADKAEEQTFRMDNLDVAKQMEKAKKNAKIIKMATGWEKGVDGKWRYEMPDAKIKDTIDVGGGNIVKRFEEDMLWTDGKLEDAVDAPKLFEAYPQLKNIKIHTDAVMNDMPSNGEYNPQTKTITIHADELKYLNSILNHEIQHVIQREEGFAHGGTPEQVERDFNAAKAEWKARSYAFELEEKAKEMGGEYNQSEVEKALIQEYKDMDMPEFIPDKETRIKGFNYFARGYADRSMDDAIKRFRLDRFQRTDFDSYQEYRKLAGEVEARNVQKRLGLTDEERRNSLASETEDVNRDEQIVMNGNDASYSIVKDPETIKKLDKEDTVKVYRAMQVGEDGKLYPPMAAKVKGKFVEPIELGKWEQADERPELADDKGMFTLNKGNGKSLKAAYNPYLHTSRTPLNDQFSEAQNRPNIVTVEVEVPKSELTSGYKADKAKDAVGEVEWKAGIIQGQLTGKRKVVLSRWDKPVRIVPDSEVADVIVNDMFKDKNITMPSNVVTPSLRKELEKRGVPFVETDNRGRIVGGENDGVHYSKVYGKNAQSPILEQKLQKHPDSLMKAGTYFSGGGLVEEGLKGIIDPVVAVEYDRKISGVYRNNFGQHIVTADVRDVDPKELVKHIDGEVEYFHASPVCKNYSQAKSNGGEVELDKETAKSTADFIDSVKPRVVTIENVKGYKDSEAMNIITKALDKNGYTWDSDVYNAADYGGYTNRERLIVRAVKDGELPEKPKKQPRKGGWLEAVEDILPTLTVKESGVAPWMDARLKADGIDWQKVEKPLYVMGSAYADGKIPHAYGDEILPTLRTKSGDVIIMPGGKVLRADGRVLARITGLGDDYKLPKTESLAHTIIGNGIPVQLTQGVIAPLLNKDDLSGRNVLARLGSSIFKNNWDADKQKQVSDRVVNTANKLGGAEATVYTSVDEVPDAYLSDVKNGATGWYDPTTHTVHVYLPNCADANEAERTVLHEKIGHEGMEVLLGGEDGVRKLANFVYNSVAASTRGKILDIANKYDPDWKNPDRMNVGTQEYIAHLAEEGPKTAEDFSLWTKIKHYLIKLLKKLGVRVPGLLNDKDLRYYLMKAGKALHVWDEMPQEKQEAMMKQASNAEIKDALSDGANLPSEEDNKPKKKTERGRIDEATGAFKLAPNGEQSNLSKKQYIEARTKNFKDWFGGDWEKKPKDFKNKLDANGEPLEKYVEGYLNRPKKPTMPKKRKGEDEATFFGRKMLYSQALEDWPKTEADWKKRIDEFDENTLAALTPPDEEAIREKYQKQYENDMASWRKDHPKIKEGEERPLKIPDMRDYQSIQDYGEAMGKYEIWKTAPHKDEYDRMAEDEIISKVALMDAVQHPFSEYARLKAMKAEFQHMRHVMQNQKVYDKNTTDAVVQFAKRFMSLGYGDDLGRGSINTLLTIVKNSTGKKSYEISQHLYQVMDVLMNNQLRNFDRAVMKTMSIKELKENAKGIQVQGKLELRGQTTIKAFRDAVSSRVSSDKLDERISNLIDKMAADKKNASSYQDELLGLNLAKQYVDYIDSSRNDAIEIEDLKKLEIENYKDRKGIYKGERTKALLQEHVERLNQYDEALFNNKVERMDRYSQLLANLGGMIDESVKGAREFQERDARRAINVKMMASADLGDKSMNQHHKENWKTRLSNSDVARLFCSPLGSFDALMREFGSKQINGEGQLWNHFVRGAMKASNDEFKSVRDANNEIDLKVSELFGKVTEDKNGNKKGNMTLNDLYALERSNKVKSLDVIIRDIEGEQTYKLQQGNLMYIYMVNKMPDGAMKLREMRILDADVERIKENIDPRFLNLADWIQGEFLPKMRTKYNKRHEELFGAPMPMVENYFPLRVLKNARYMEEDVNNTSDGSNALPSTATGAIIKRKTNKLPLDILNADALSVTIDNIKEMENWYNYAPIRKDANTLLSDTTFRNRVQNMTTIYGSGERLWNNVKDATAVAMGTYRPKGGTDLAVSIKNIGKGITGAKISGRLYTAFKQILSFPLFLADADLGRFAWYSVNPYGSFKWAIENMPNFDKRWSGRKLGDTVLMDDPTDWKLWHTNLMEKAAYYGMTPNALVDAVTCAVGARAVYDTKYKQYIKAGLTEEKAKEKALSDAEINFNTSQQSSEGAFVSPMQLDRTLESAIFTPFRNSSMLYERKGINALRNLKHRFEKGHKEASIKYMAAQLMEEGVGYEQATKAAEKMYKKGLMHNIADAIVALWLGPIIWNLGGSLGYLIPYLGDDENKKKKMVIDAVILGLLEGPVDGLAGGQFINTAIANTITSDGISLRGLKNVDFSGMPMLSDFNSMIEKFGYDKVAGAQDLMFMVMQSGTGFNPKTLTDAINACIDYGNGDMTNAKEIALFVFRLMNGPAATVDNLYIDELGMKGKDAKKLSYEELAKRYAEYKFGKNTFGLGKLYSDEEKQKKLKAIEKSFDKKVSERLAGMDREDLKNEFSESRSQKEKKLIGKIIADELETKDSEAVKKAKADASYLRQRNFSDLMDDLYLQKEWEATNEANAGLEELKGNGASEKEIEAYKTKHKAALDKRKAIQKARKEMQKKKADISSDNDEATMAAIRKLRDSILKTVRQTKK